MIRFFKILFLAVLPVILLPGVGPARAQAQLLINPYQYNAFTAEYQAVLDRATTLGYTKPSAAQQVKQNQLVADLKAAGIWSQLDVLYVFATDGDSDFATLNWKSPSTFQASKVNSPTFTSNQGFTGNGSSSYINTNWTPSAGVNFTQDNASVCTYVVDNSAQAGYVYGVANVSTTRVFALNPRDVLDRALYAANISTIVNTSGQTSSIGFYHLARTDAINFELNKDGTQIVTNSITSSTRSTQSLFGLAYNNNGTASAFSTRTIGMLSTGSNLISLKSAYYTA